MHVFVLVADSLRRDHLGCYGNEWIGTPNIDGLAADAVLFTEAYPESLPTLPVRNALLSGRHCGPELGWGPMRNGDLRLPEIFTGRGYTTALVTDVYHMMKPGMNFHRGFHSWQWIRGQEQDPFRTDENPNPPVPREYCEKHDRRLLQFCKNVAGFDSESDYFTARVYDTAGEWVRRNHANGNLFLWIDGFDPHEPWYPPPGYADKYDPEYAGDGCEPIGVAYGPWRDHLTERQLKRMCALYAGEVSFLDACVGRFIGTLKELGIYEQSLILFLSDHGHLIGEHGIVGKNWITNGYREVLDLAAMIKFPENRFGGSRMDALCYNIDLVPTLLSAANIEVPRRFDGIDLMPSLEESAARAKDGSKQPTATIRECVTCSYNPKNMVVKTMNWTLLLDYEHNPLMLFDRHGDPREAHNLVTERTDVVNALLELEANDWAHRPRSME